MLDNHQSNEDLKAFERRLTEILAYYQPQTKRWRIILMIATLSTSFTASNWLFDPETGNISFVKSLHNHKFFTFNCIVLLVLFMIGIHRKVVAPAIIVSRIRSVLENFNMSCDHDGRLILKRATSTLPPLSNMTASQHMSTNSLITTTTTSSSSSSSTLPSSSSSVATASFYRNGNANQCLPTIGRT